MKFREPSVPPAAPPVAPPHALAARWPRLGALLPHVPLGDWPTPLERIEGLTPPSVELWVKREDLASPLYGGNKVRKLEFLLAEAESRGCGRVSTIGGIGSHHTLATALFARRRGLRAAAIAFPQPVNDHVRQQILALAASGAELQPLDGVWELPGAIFAEQTRVDTLFIPGGGSSVTGTLGWASAGLELLGQALPFDAVYVALGSNGTVAGLLYGLAGAPETELVAVRVVDRVVANAWAVRRLARGVADRLGALDPESRVRGGPSMPLRGGSERTEEPLPWERLAPRLRVAHGQFGGAYGRTTAEAEEAVARAREVGLSLEPTYTGKALAQLLLDARSGRLDGKRVLFVQTYSSADLSALLAQAPPVSSLPPLLRRAFE
jgi:1-aminocyclopropane-1-carboxylate deaminase/D-cysteine desulfhydrase-like pyridoxal-dependent ACC family enzyme